MPRLALFLCLLWFLSLFVYRSLLHWRRTGSTGVHGFRGAIGSLPWLAGTAASLGLLLGPLAPAATLLGWPGGALLASHPALHLAGAALALTGNAGALVAQLGMGDSWRVGVDDGETTELVTDGLFTWVRNPIFSFVILTVLGLVMMVPNALALLACGLTVLGIELQVRAVEEPYLRATHGAAYARYTEEVGRFVPKLGRHRVPT